MARPKQKRRGKKKSASSTAELAKVEAAQTQDVAQNSGGADAKINGASAEAAAVAAEKERNENLLLETAVGSEDEKTLVEKDAPALIGLLEEYQKKVELVEKQLNGGVEKVMEEAEEEQIDTNDGISLLEVKYQVMLSYCIRICFYILLKLTGKSVNKNKLVEQQAHLRVLLEKLRPIDKKIKYQVSQLLRTAAMDTESAEKDTEGANPLAFKPSPGKLIKTDEAQGTQGQSEVYKPPQVAPTEVIDKKDRRKAKRNRKMREKAASNSVIKTLKDMVSTAPEEVDIGGGNNDQDATAMEREKYEEENFVRLQEKKKDKAIRKKKEQEKNAIDNVGDLEEFVDIMKAAGESKAEDTEGRDELAALRKEKALKSVEKGDATNNSNKKRKLEEDVSQNQPGKKKPARSQKKKKKKQRR
mmetsp:Transcript_2882/g.4182  ORF Transcript_2882/g.4182 Transcript_2882/m.4182 type:complete len:415 (-) Transcript_2882:67-1311(-)|eukprot:CAMPEP_0184503494 /NCGR_PEP_ID=MMETSP0113_2-20130426/51895_1 /TAXON_ID=91329 /ORGANISM="Norrisiella sphaerica, Strain BC52" /LENGTH=414 /DNA_ID=CAMNT_0026892997 /DNA_START=90 /DNA_END=1334 /DNA_ORIENTATION=-